MFIAYNCVFIAYNRNGIFWDLCKYLFYASLVPPSDVCKSPKEAPKFEWLHKYHKASKGQGGVKQTLAPLGTTHTKISQHKKTGKPTALFVSLSVISLSVW